MPSVTTLQKQGFGIVILQGSMVVLGTAHSSTHQRPALLFCQVLDVDAPPTVTAALCRCMCYPRVVLKCGALREALAFMGHSGNEGEEVS